MIRLAKENDIPELVEMLIAFQSEAQCYSQVSPCRKSLHSSVKTIIDGDKSDILIYDDNSVIAGATGVMAYPSWFNFEVLTGQEMFWYIKPEYRTKFGIAFKMFKWLEKWAEDHNLHTLSVASTGTLKVDKLQRFYEKMGYVKWDVLYTKRIR